jgi:hypothetical protein
MDWKVSQRIEVVGLLATNSLEYISEDLKEWRHATTSNEIYKYKLRCSLLLNIGFAKKRRQQSLRPLLERRSSS